jgi:two-component system sensor histidine kinase DesK
VAAELLAFAYQAGVLAELQKAGIGGLLEGNVLGLLLGISAGLAYMVLFDRLISSRIRSEYLVHELRATQKQLEEALATEKEVAVLRERNRLAREMHDVLGHSLVLVAVKIEAAQRLQAVDPERAAAELESTKELVRQSMTDLRVSLADLRSPTFEAGKMPLGKALGDWTARTAHEGELSVKFESESGVEALPAPIQDALWRVGREAVLNVVKHARAEHVEVHLFIKDGNVYLSVGDDGVGIAHLAEGTARLEVEGHYGIRGMRERLEVLGGQLTLKPGRDGRGTLLLASVPLPVKDGLQPVPERSEGTDDGGAESNKIARNLSSVVRRP